MGFKTFGDTDSSTHLSPNYTLGDLTITNQGTPNMPTTQDQMDNLTSTAINLEALTQAVGPFKILSAFRSPETEAALTGSGQPTAEKANSGALSFHEEGLAVDIYPTTMSPIEFFGKLCAIIGTTDQPGTWRDVYSEIAYKPSQNSIHLALAVSYKKNVFLSLNSAGTYTKLTDDEIAGYANQYGADYGVQYQQSGMPSEVNAPVEEDLGAASGFSTGQIIMALGIGIVIFYAIKKG